MENATLKMGCQTFTWEMLGEKWQGGPDDLLSAVSAAGYAGIEITDTMIGHYASSPATFQSALSAHDLTLVAFAFGSPSGFSEPDQLADDLETTRRWIDFAAHFPEALISIGSATQMSAGQRIEKILRAAEFYNQAARLGQENGVAVAVHPSSHHNTLLFDRQDYDQLFTELDAECVGWVPDTGHMLRGAIDLPDTLQTYLSRIRYVHLKDVDASGQWVMMGDGVCNIRETLAIAATAPHFTGWVVAEEESAAAAADPVAAVATNRQVLRQYSGEVLQH